MLLPKVLLPEKALFAFNTNLDSVKHISGAQIEQMAYDIPDELRELRATMRRGGQREVRIGDATACWIEQVLGCDYLLVGGQAGNAANTASSLGVNCLLHTNYKTDAILSRFASPSQVFIAENRAFVPASKISERTPQATHYILEFTKGDCLYGRRIPHSNRFIASYDPFEMRLDKQFSAAITRELPQLSKAFVGGFHLLREPDSLEQFTKEMVHWRKLNPNLVIHLELGEFMNEKVLAKVRKDIFPLINSLGMNEQEYKSLGVPLPKLAKKIPEIIVHSPHRIITRPLSLRNQDAVRFAQLVASYRAKTRKLPSCASLASFARSQRSLFAGHPTTTVGLGDTFASAYFMAR